MKVEHFCGINSNAKEQGSSPFCRHCRGIANWDFVIEAPKEMLFGTLNLPGPGIAEQSCPKADIPCSSEGPANYSWKIFRNLLLYTILIAGGIKTNTLSNLLICAGQIRLFLQTNAGFNEQLHLEKAYFHRLETVL